MTNLLDILHCPRDRESFQDILVRPGCRIERIVSFGQSSPEGFWYDQDWDEWVLLLQGTAVLALEGAQPLRLDPGDHCMIPARTRHRVESTNPDGPTIWLALHFDEPSPAAPSGAASD